MDKSIRFYDAGAEGFYHGLVLGLIALMDNQYKIKSNRESGDGRNIAHHTRDAVRQGGSGSYGFPEICQGAAAGELKIHLKGCKK